MSERIERRNFWRQVAKGELKLQRKIEAEFIRHEAAMRALMLEVRMSMPRQKKLEN